VFCLEKCFKPFDSKFPAPATLLDSSEGRGAYGRGTVIDAERAGLKLFAKPEHARGSVRNLIEHGRFQKGAGQMFNALPASENSRRHLFHPLRNELALASKGLDHFAGTHNVIASLAFGLFGEVLLNGLRDAKGRRLSVLEQ
jgi:hypothetical protein